MGQAASYSQQANEAPFFPEAVDDQDHEVAVMEGGPLTNDLFDTTVQHRGPEQIDWGSPVNSDIEEEGKSQPHLVQDGIMTHPDVSSRAGREDAFVPRVDQNWRERNIISLVLGHRSRAPLLHPEPDCAPQRPEETRTSDHQETDAANRISLENDGSAPFHQESYPGSDAANHPLNDHEVSFHPYPDMEESASWDRPNVLFSLMARESTGKPSFRRGPTRARNFRSMGGEALFSTLDRPSAGIASQVVLLNDAISLGNWADTHVIVSRLASRLVTTPNEQSNDAPPRADPHTPPQAPKFHAGGGRVGLERDTFCIAGGVRALMSIFRERAFVGSGLASSGDARDLSTVTVTLRLAQCWNHTLMILRELLYFTPQLVARDTCWMEFLPFLFTLLSHKSCFEGAAAMIEEILSAMAQQPDNATTFCLAGIPNLFSLWRGFSPQQLGHFCRVLALLIFEPEDRALLETSTVIKSLDLLRLRRTRSARRDPTVDMNQAILLSDEVLVSRLIKLLRIMNYAPPLRRFAPYHVLARYPFVVDTLVMLGLGELSLWEEFETQDVLAGGSPGGVADMLETLHTTLGQPNTQMSHILHVITAAQRTGVISGRHRRDEDVAEDESDEASAVSTFAGLLTDQMLATRFYRSTSDDNRTQSPPISVDPRDAANTLQFNAMLLGPFQVECLFVLCTLLGGRRKMDAQDTFMNMDLVPVLENMFQRLPFAEENPSEGDVAAAQPHGIHGPNCDCTPESALCIQFLRLLHNFCDRDCESYEGRQLMLSGSERCFVAGFGRRESTTAGLLTKIIKAFMRVDDESPYRFWLSSCIESFLRGSSRLEQLFVARSGLLDFLLESVCSDRLFCSGSLQTLFDVLGEIGKGNPEVIQELVSGLDEERFCKLMQAATENLVDSNVFLRSVLLSLERHRVTMSSLERTDLRPAYLTHSWIDVASNVLPESKTAVNEAGVDHLEISAALEWFPSNNFEQHHIFSETGQRHFNKDPFGWVFAPVEGALGMQPYPPNSMERLDSVLTFNRARLLRDLLDVIDLGNINHENICCANTAVILTILAHRRSQLSCLLGELRRMSREERESRQHALSSKTSQVTPSPHLASHHRDGSHHRRRSCSGVDGELDVLVNFREILWFWLEYYSHRGRDRLSLEFSSHIRFHEWETVVRLLVADDGSATSLLDSRIRLPRSPYRRTAAVTGNRSRRGT